MARTQKNKATAHHLGLLKAKLAKLRRELITPSGGGGGKGEGFDVAKTVRAPLADYARNQKERMKERMGEGKKEREKERKNGRKGEGETRRRRSRIYMKR